MARILQDGYGALCDELKYDRLGSVFGIKKSKNPDAATFMIASPLDEVGLMVSEVKNDGTLAFIPLEGVASSLSTRGNRDFPITIPRCSVNVDAYPAKSPGWR